MKSSNIGGQAVLEGIMMKHGDDYAVAVRKPNGEIVVEKDTYHSVIKWKKLTQIPFVRGAFNFIDSMVLGIKTLTFSASFFEEEEVVLTKEEAEKKEKKEKIMMGGTVALSMVLAVAIFMVLPYLLSSLLKPVVTSYYWRTVIEGFVRIGIFLAYVAIISKMEDIQRTFMYHGAEHKCINCIENGLELNVENVLKSSKHHKRCGTSFLFIVMVVSIIFFIFIRVTSPVLRVAIRLLLIPIIAGVSYELIKLAGRSESKFVQIISYPGMMMQRLTTKEPDAEMVEVAIAAVEAVFDWDTFIHEELEEVEV